MNKVEEARQAFEKLCRAANGEYYIGKPKIQLIREVLNSIPEVRTLVKEDPPAPKEKFSFK